MLNKEQSFMAIQSLVIATDMLCFNSSTECNTFHLRHFKYMWLIENVDALEEEEKLLWQAKRCTSSSVCESIFCNYIYIERERHHCI